MSPTASATIGPAAPRPQAEDAAVAGRHRPRRARAGPGPAIGSRRRAGRQARRVDAGRPFPVGEGRPGYKSFAVTYPATAAAERITNTLVPNHRWLQCLPPHDMIASCGQPGPPARLRASAHRIVVELPRSRHPLRRPGRARSSSAGVYPPDKDFPLAAARERLLRFPRFVADSSAWPRSERGVKQGPARAGVYGTGRNSPMPAGDRRPLRAPVPASGSP